MDKKKGTKSKGIHRKRPKPKGKGTPFKKAFKPEDRDRRVMFGGGAGGAGPKGKAKFLTHGMKKFSNTNKRPGTPGAGKVRLTNEEATKRKMMAERMQSRLALGLEGERTAGQVLRGMYRPGTNRDDMSFQNLTIGEQFGILGVDKSSSGRLFGLNAASPMPYQRNTYTETATAPDVELRPGPPPMLVQPPENPMGQGGVQMQPGGPQDKEAPEGPYFQDAGDDGGFVPPGAPPPNLGMREQRKYQGLDQEQDEHIMMPRGPDKPVFDQNLDVPPPQEVGESARFRRAPRETKSPQQQQQTQETPSLENIQQSDPFHIEDTMKGPTDYRREKLEEKERDAIIQDHVQDTINDMVTDLEFDQRIDESGFGIDEDSGLTPLFGDIPDAEVMEEDPDAEELRKARERTRRNIQFMKREVDREGMEIEDLEGGMIRDAERRQQEQDPGIFQGATELVQDAGSALFDYGTQTMESLREAGSQFGDMLQIGVPVSPNTIQSNPDPIEGAGAGMVTTPRLLAPKDDPPEEHSLSESDQGGYVMRAGRKVFYKMDSDGNPRDPLSNDDPYFTQKELASWNKSVSQRKRRQPGRKQKRRKARREGKPPNSPKHKGQDERRKKERAERRRKKEQAEKRKEFSKKDRRKQGGSGGPADV